MTCEWQARQLIKLSIIEQVTNSIKKKVVLYNFNSSKAIFCYILKF